MLWVQLGNTDTTAVKTGTNDHVGPNLRLLCVATIPIERDTSASCTDIDSLSVISNTVSMLVADHSMANTNFVKSFASSSGWTGGRN